MSEHDHHKGRGTDDPSHPHIAPLSDVQLRVRALESLLVGEGLVDPSRLGELIDQYQGWTDPDFKSRLLQDASSVLAGLGFIGRQGQHVVVLGNMPTVHTSSLADCARATHGRSLVYRRSGSSRLPDTHKR